MTSDLIHQMRIACPKDYPLGELFNQGADALEKAEAERDDLLNEVTSFRSSFKEQVKLKTALKEAIELLKPFAAFADQTEGFVQARVEQGGSPKLATNRFRVEHFRAARRFVDARIGGDDENG